MNINMLSWTRSGFHENLFRNYQPRFIIDRMRPNGMMLGIVVGVDNTKIFDNHVIPVYSHLYLYRKAHTK